jgi:hypothetical protein
LFNEEEKKPPRQVERSKNYVGNVSGKKKGRRRLPHLVFSNAESGFFFEKKNGARGEKRPRGQFFFGREKGGAFLGGIPSFFQTVPPLFFFRRPLCQTKR